jgi:hypothetical protein
LDALQEFRIETSSYAAEFGRTPGGQISLLTRSGTNQFHGSGSYYFRNEALDANDWFANANRQPKPKERQSLFGGVLGGPIRRERLFFFGSYEGLRLQQPQVMITAVPTVAVRAQSAPALRPYLNAFPLPNGQDFEDGTAQLTGSYSNPGRFNIFALRLDGKVTNSLTGFFRFSNAPSEAVTRINALSTNLKTQADNDAYTGGLTWIAGPHLTADLRFNWTRNRVTQFIDLDTFGGAVIPAPSEVFSPVWDPSRAQFSLRALNAEWDWGLGEQGTQRQFNVVGAVTWSRGVHQLKLGGDYRRLFPLLGGGGSSELLDFETVEEITGGRADFYVIKNGDQAPREPIFSNLSLYAQDTWRVGRRLMLTYGLRFERVPPPTEATGRMARTVLGIENDVFENLRLAPEGTPLWGSRAGELAPRVGIAYQLCTHSGWETTLRGGTGLFYDLGLGDIARAFFFNAYPFTASRQTSHVALPLSTAIRTPPTLGIDPPSSLQVMDPNLRLPYTIQWNGTLEQSLGPNQAVTLAYVGAAGRRLLIVQNTFNQVLAQFPNSGTTLNIQRSIGRSTYRALQAQYRHRLHHEVQALASYTLGRSLDNASQANLNTPATSVGGVFDQEFGTSDFDVRQILSAAITYNLPKISGPALLQALTRGWGLDLLVRYQSAFPVNPIGSQVTAGGTFYQARPNLVPGQPLYINDPAVPGGRRFNRAAFIRAAAGQQGDFPRNGLRGFPASQVDLALNREFRLRESLRLQLRAEVFNLFNHPNFGPPQQIITSGLFGRPNRMLNQSLGGLNGLYQMGGPRSGQLAIKVSF